MKTNRSLDKARDDRPSKVRPITYKMAGVDIDAGNALVKMIKKSAPWIGGFSGVVELPNGHKKPVLVGTTDGVGTKVKIAQALGIHDTIGIDLVAMNVNDLICVGAKPLFFLDYFATGKLDVGVAHKVIQGIFKGCRIAGCRLLGGETAEMPGMYKPGEYDLAGFAVGIADKSKVLNGRGVKPGDVLIGLPSSGVHSNGYSLVRKLFRPPEVRKLRKILLAPTVIYVKKILKLLSHPGLRDSVRGIAHITGGGFQDNIPRVIPRGFQIRVRKNSWPKPEIFNLIQKRSGLPDEEMYRTLNMGIGLVLVVDRKKAEAVRRFLKPAYEIGVIERGNKGVILEL
jgi:phosphoribosylformylglycinamidine cyclo-ligase